MDCDVICSDRPEVLEKSKPARIAATLVRAPTELTNPGKRSFCLFMQVLLSRIVFISRISDSAKLVRCETARRSVPQDADCFHMLPIGRQLSPGTNVSWPCYRCLWRADICDLSDPQRSQAAFYQCGLCVRDSLHVGCIVQVLIVTSELLLGQAVAAAM
jgi:hypothetical protein